MATKIIINRKSELINRSRGIKFFLDDREMGMVSNGSSGEYLIESGMHKMQCRINWGSSEELNIYVKEGETKFLKLKSGMIYYTAGYILFAVSLLSGFIMSIAHIPKPTNFEWLQFALVLPFLFYYIYYLTLGRKRYLLLEEDTGNFFN